MSAAFAFQPALSVEALRSELDRAIVAGGNDPLLRADPELDRNGTSRVMMANAGRRIFEVTQLATHVQARLKQVELDPDDVLAGTVVTHLRTTLAAEIRFTARAIQAHARENSYDAAAWLEQACFTVSSVQLAAGDADAASPTVLGEVRAAIDALFDAISRIGADRMGVPEALSEALGHWLALYLAARPLPDR